MKSSIVVVSPHVVGDERDDVHICVFGAESSIMEAVLGSRSHECLCRKSVLRVTSHTCGPFGVLLAESAGSAIGRGCLGWMGGVVVLYHSVRNWRRP